MSQIAFGAVLYFSLDEEMFPSSDKSVEASTGMNSAVIFIYSSQLKIV